MDFEVRFKNPDTAGGNQTSIKCTVTLTDKTVQIDNPSLRRVSAWEEEGKSKNCTSRKKKPHQVQVQVIWAQICKITVAKRRSSEAQQ